MCLQFELKLAEIVNCASALVFSEELCR